jgi:hypothetical protein
VTTGTFCLSLHADYACRHSGACCRTWEVAADPHVIDLVRHRYGADAAARAFKNDADRARPVRIAHAHGACVFRQHQRCLLHADGGAAALPVGCRHFPRVVLRDSRGTFVAFSHYCPTAVELLTRAEALDIVEAGPSVRLCEPLEGLDARDALPPLLRPGMLTDLEGYDAWERSVIVIFARAQNASAALDAVDGATERIRSWSPGRDRLRERVLEAFATPHSVVRGQDAGSGMKIVAELSGAVPHDGHRGLDAAWRAAGGEAPEIQHVVLNFLAARTLGNWVAYQGRGLRTIVAWLRACHDVLRVLALRGPGPLLGQQLVVNRTHPYHRLCTDGVRDGGLSPLVLAAIRQTDLLMLHSLDSLAFARTAARLEQRAA